MTLLIDRAQHIARFAVTTAIEDEACHRGGHCMCSETFATFLEHRIAAALRLYMPDEERLRPRYDA